EMKKCNSYYRVEINNVIIGYASVIYDYRSYQPYIASELVPYGIIKNVPNIQLSATNWATYLEEPLQSTNGQQEKQLIRKILSGYITNLNGLNERLELLRQSFN